MRIKIRVRPQEVAVFCDALLGDFDGHNDNWGILVDEHSKTAEIARIYDCESCPFPQLASKDMGAVLNNGDEIDKRVYVFPASSIAEDEKKTTYFEFISSLKNPNCTAALKRVSERIDMKKIIELIDEMPILPPVQKEFYTAIILERKEKIIDYSMKQLMKLETVQEEPNSGQQFTV